MAGELVLAQAELAVMIAGLHGDDGVGGQELNELERVLLVRVPDRLAPCFVSRVPVVSAADQTDRELPPMELLPSNLSPGNG